MCWISKCLRKDYRVMVLGCSVLGKTSVTETQEVEASCIMLLTRTNLEA
jgi:hypothetical protein